VVVIDVRPSALFAKGHIPWARSIPWSLNLKADKTMKSADELLAHFASHGVTPDKNIASHCQDGKASAHSYFTLRLLGYPRLRSYDRSWMEWGAADDLPKTVPAARG
jgi:thiosulfate/3-mercaptopyruvate sulfurtransferase